MDNDLIYTARNINAMLGLPKIRMVGLVKPDVSIANCADTTEDPWSAGKPLYETTFVPAITMPINNNAYDALYSSFNNNAIQKTVEIVEATINESHTKKKQKHFVQLARFSICPGDNRLGDVELYEQLNNLPDLSVPIHFQNDQTDSLPIVAMYGIKLCVRRAAFPLLSNRFAVGYEHTYRDGCVHSASLEGNNVNEDVALPHDSTIRPTMTQKLFLVKQAKQTLKAIRLFHLCRIHACADFVALLDVFDIPIDYQDSQGDTFLHIATQLKSLILIKECLRRGANLNIQNHLGKTALHVACQYKFGELAELLVDKGADESIVDKENLTCYGENCGQCGNIHMESILQD